VAALRLSPLAVILLVKNRGETMHIIFPVSLNTIVSVSLNKLVAVTLIVAVDTAFVLMAYALIVAIQN
jgi:hypothetical protein